MIKRSALSMLIVALLSAAVAGYGNDKKSIIETARSYEDFIGANVKFGVEASDVFDKILVEKFNVSECNITQYTTMADMLAALDSGKVDALLFSDLFGKQLQYNGIYPNFKYFEVPQSFQNLKAGAVFNNEEIRDKWNAWFETVKADGTWKRLCEFWIDNPLPDEADIPKYEFDGINGTLVMADTGNYPPFTYVAGDGQLAGFDMEMASLFAQSLGMNLEIVPMSYEAIIPYVQSGKAI
ncbi:MAG: transporter substrate-binding domain-containing protein, partial [Synergistaceae bacterium]|nr:transporter substrate-binding domain-containing protein [Synergistaceae bacterium]